MVAMSLAAVLLAGCGGSSSSEAVERPSGGSSKKTKAVQEEPEECFDGQRKVRQVILTLAGWRGPDSASLLMAEKRGYFADVGISPAILSPASPNRPVKYVVQGVDDLGLVQQPQVALAKENGAPIVAVGSLISRPTATMIWLEGSKIGEIADLKGKTIGIPGLPFQRGLLESVLARAGLALEDVTIRGVGYDLVPELVGGRVDAIFGGSENVEGIELEARGLDPVITPVERLGVPPYEELVFIARSDCVAKHPQVIRDFMAAVRRGAAAAAEDPSVAAREIAASFEANPETSRQEMEVGVRATLPLLSRAGRMSLRRADRLVDWMYGQGLVGKGFLELEPSASTWLTNEYVR